MPASRNGPGDLKKVNPKTLVIPYAGVKGK